MAKAKRVPSTKRTTAPVVDPVIALTASADRLLNEYMEARNAVELARAKLGRDARAPSVAPPALGLWSTLFLFTSEDHIEEEFETVTRRLRDEIKAGACWQAAEQGTDCSQPSGAGSAS